jgi:thioredoxin 1
MRVITPLTVSAVSDLASAVQYRLGKDTLRPAPPISIKDSEHFREVIGKQPDRLFVVDFFASWCGPCKALAPVFRKLSLRTPTAVFLKVDIDECDKLATEFKIEKFPTVKFLRGGSKLSNQVAEIKGGGPQFLFEFVQILNEKATKEETALLQKFTFNAPGDNVDVVLQNMASSAEQVSELVTQPLQSVGNFVTQNTRKVLGMPEVNPNLAFDVSNHEASKTAVAASVLSRIKDDVAAYATVANTAMISKIMNLADTDIVGFFEGKPEAEEVLREAHEGIQELLEQLYDLRDSDAQMVEDTIPLLEKASNWVNVYGESTGKDTQESKTLFLLNRMAGRNSDVWIEFLFGT